MKTPISYYGGKQRLLKHILPLIPSHQRYTEPFAGGAAVLFAKDPVPCEVINDLNGELMMFYKVAKTNYPALKQRIDVTLHSRDAHAQAGHILNYPCFYTPEDIAWAVWYRCKSSYSSRLDGSFGYDFSGRTSRKLHNAKSDFTQELCDRLERVTIESADAPEVIKRYDSPNAFHFIDPPYFNSHCGHYDGMFSEANLNDLLQLLATVEGKWMLTMYPYDKIVAHATKYGWTIHKVTRRISSAKTARRLQEEWLVTNYPAPFGER